MGNWKLVLVIIYLMVLVSCGEDDKNPPNASDSNVFMTLNVSQPQIGVGLDTPIILTASVTKDAVGETCTFEASFGSFSTIQPSLTSTEPVDLNGQATVLWYAPEIPGMIRFSSEIQTVQAHAEIEVIPVPQIEIIDLPDSVKIGETVLFQIQVPTEWAGKAVEVSAPQSILKAAGPVLEDLHTGNRILPLTDSNGLANVLFTAPGTPMQVILTASMFGTIESLLVQIF